MGQRKITISEEAIESISSVAWYIESKGMLLTSEKFIRETYSFIYKIDNSLVIHRNCRDLKRSFLDYKCVNYKKKYTIVFTETESEIAIHEFMLSKMIN